MLCKVYDVDRFVLVAWQSTVNNTSVTHGERERERENRCYCTWGGKYSNGNMCDFIVGFPKLYKSGESISTSMIQSQNNTLYVIMTRKSHKHRSQTNPWHNEEIILEHRQTMLSIKALSMVCKSMCNCGPKIKQFRLHFVSDCILPH